MNSLSEWNLKELSIFKCQLCKLRLNYRIIQVRGIGAICNNCYEREVFTNVVYNVRLEEDMSKLNFPCRYENRGCIFEASFLTTSSHEARCSFRDRICPFTYIHECEHNLISDPILHFRQKHIDKILDCKDKLETIRFPETEKYETFYLIKLKYTYFLLRIKLYMRQQTIRSAFYYFGNYSGGFEFTFAMKNEDFNLISRNSRPLHESELGCSFNENHGLKINLSIVNLNNNRISLRVNHHYKEMREELQHFECPICFDFMIDEIHICTNGHSVCHKCRNILNRCPTCRSNFSGRNYCLESLSKIIKFPCKNSNNCEEFIAGDRYRHHNSECFYEIYECPFSNTSDRCLWTGLYSDLLFHLQNDHEGLLYQNGNALTLPLAVKIKYVRCFIVENDIIICSYELNDDFTISLYSRPFIRLFNNQLICKVFIGEQCNSNRCILQFSVPFQTSKGVDVSKFMSNGELRLIFLFKRTEDMK